MIMPSHAKNVKHYSDPMPLFARYQVESYLGGMFNPVVQLKSGGYIVIGVTEALVAIDVNSGKATKEASIEETALKTNLEAAEEVARQLRLRDLAGLIVIDFIDMEERKNNAAVEKRFKDRLKTDRARIQVGRISGFGLLEMSRQRLRPGMLEASTQPCPACHGTGLIRSDDSVGLTILRQLEEEGVRRRSREVLVKAPVSIVNFLMNMKREHIAQIEARYGMAVRLEADPHMIAPEFTVEKFKTATRRVETASQVISVDASLMEDFDEEIAAEEAEIEAPEASDASEEDKPKRKRRRRRRRRGKGGEAQSGEGSAQEAQDAAESEDASRDAVAEDAKPDSESSDAEEEKPKRRRTRRKKKDAVEPAAETAQEDAASEPAEASDTQSDPTEAAEPEEKPKRRRTRKKKEPEPEAEAAPDTPEAAAEPESVPEPEAEASPEASEAATEPEKAEEPEEAPEPEPAKEPAMAEASAEGDKMEKPRRKGWWSIGR
jgi:ribonuclease E